MSFQELRGAPVSLCVFGPGHNGVPWKTESPSSFVSLLCRFFPGRPEPFLPLALHRGTGPRSPGRTGTGLLADVESKSGHRDTLTPTFYRFRRTNKSSSANTLQSSIIVCLVFGSSKVPGESRYTEADSKFSLPPASPLRPLRLLSAGPVVSLYTRARADVWTVRPLRRFVVLGVSGVDAFLLPRSRGARQ